jgi:hypothetical protein
VLYDVSARSAADIWAVGTTGGTGPSVTLTEHWDGLEWSIVPSPSPSLGGSRLSGVAPVSQDDVWAVGTNFFGTEFLKPILEHWNGNAWTIVPSPDPGSDFSELLGVAPLSWNDVWVVGWHGQSTLIEHWDGMSWSIVPSPAPGSFSALTDVAVLTPTDIWAVGWYQNLDEGNDFPLTEHWDGVRWTVVGAQDQEGNFPILNAVAAATPSDIWAVGGQPGTLAEHWDGATWNIVPTLDPAQPDELTDVAAVSGTDVWAVGNKLQEFTAFSEWWGGSSWVVIPTPGSIPTSLYGITVAPDGHMWAVGSLILQRCGAPAVTVKLDIKPGSETNTINPSSRGIVPVAVLSTDSIDATTLDPATVCFGDAETPGERDCTVAHGKAHFEDVDSDGDIDIVLGFDTDETGIDPGDGEACLSGETFDGVAVSGCEAITTV